MNKQDIETIEQGFYSTLAWCTWESPDFADMQGLDEIPDTVTIDDETINKLITDIVREFIERCPIDLIKDYLENSSVKKYWNTLHAFGQDLYLTSEGHGAGFWDRGIDSGDALTELSKKCNTIHVWYDADLDKVRAE